MENLSFLFYKCDINERLSFIRIIFLLLKELKISGFEINIMKLNKVLKDKENKNITDSYTKIVNRFVDEYYYSKKEDFRSLKNVKYMYVYFQLFFSSFFYVFQNLIIYEHDKEIKFNKTDTIDNIYRHTKIYLNDLDVFIQPIVEKIYGTIPCTLNLSLTKKIYNILLE